MARPELLALLHACREDPGEDAPRQVLADWLEEHGGPADQARARFVRLQCERDPGSRPGQEEADLLTAGQAEWLGALADYKPNWTRGMLTLTVSPRTISSRRWSGLKESEAGAWVDGLSFVGVGHKPLKQLLTRAGVSALNALIVRNASLEPAALAGLGSHPALTRLVRLDLGDNHLGPEGVRTLVEGFPGDRLRSLNLWSNQIGPDGAAALAGWPGLARLSEWNLAYNALGPAGMEALCASPHLPSPWHLDFWSNDIQDDGTAALARSCLLARTAHVQLSWSEMGDAGLAGLADSPHLAHARELILSRNQIGDAGAAALAASPRAARLRRLDLDSNRIGDEGAAALAESPHLAGLERVSVRSNRLGERGTAALRAGFGGRLQE